MEPHNESSSKKLKVVLLDILNLQLIIFQYNMQPIQRNFAKKKFKVSSSSHKIKFGESWN